MITHITGRKIAVRSSVRRQVGGGTRCRPFTIVAPSRYSFCPRGPVAAPLPPDDLADDFAAAGLPAPFGGVRTLRKPRRTSGSGSTTVPSRGSVS